MKKETTGTVISVSKQWWFKINTKAVRKGPMDGAVFPHIIEYTSKKWIRAGAPVPIEGSSVKVVYNDDVPAKAKIFY